MEWSVNCEFYLVHITATIPEISFFPITFLARQSPDLSVSLIYQQA